MALRPTLLALAAAAVLLTGCGAADDAPAPLPLGTGAATPAQGAGTVEKTDGRLGGATMEHPAGGLRELSPGGRLDVTPTSEFATLPGSYRLIARPVLAGGALGARRSVAFRIRA